MAGTRTSSSIMSSPTAAAVKAATAATSSSSSPTQKHYTLRETLDREEAARKSLSSKVHKRMVSLTGPEAFFLHALLVDDNDDDNNNNQGGGEKEEPFPAAADMDKKSSPEEDDDEANNNDNQRIEERTQKMERAAKKLNDEMLFSVPKHIPDYFAKNRKKKRPPKPRRPSTKGLWSAFEAGVHPRSLMKRSSYHSAASLASSRSISSDHSSFCSIEEDGHDRRHQQQHPLLSSPRQQPLTPRGISGGGGGIKPTHRRRISSKDLPPRPAPRDGLKQQKSGDSIRSLITGTSSKDEADLYPSDVEVRPEEPAATDDDDDGNSSWDSKDDANHLHYDAWEVLKDEYASDFGFDFAPGGHQLGGENLNYGSDDDDCLPHSFRILGTSADDQSAQPHVMSPPMMDALMNFLPEKLAGQNYWLRFSLVRDGACLDTLKRYVRASQYTLLAIETPKGEVFGSFTSSHWRNNYGFYGKTPAFVWKMRHSRRTKSASLFDQAQLESEIDVFMALGYHDRIQVCRHDAIAVGGDEDMPRIEDYDTLQEALEAANQSGFAICLDDDLLRGTTSHCSAFHNPSLVGSGSKTEIFDVAGLEVWTLTPCFDVPSAEKNEMTKFFIEESFRSSTSSLPGSPGLTNSRRGPPQFSRRDLEQDEFYRRIGHEDFDSESRRNQWQYVNIMSGIGDHNKGLGASPRFA